MFKLKIEWIGIDHKRFLLNDGEGRYWDGNGWTASLSSHRLYVSHQDACREFKKLAEEHFRNCPVREFQVLTTVKVYADLPFTMQELQEYLSSVCTLVLTASCRGQGPVEDSYAQVEIPWDDLVETTINLPTLPDGRRSEKG